MNISFREVVVEDARMILDWRTSERVTKYMSTDIAYSLDRQKQWIENSRAREDYYHWIIELESRAVGLIDIDRFSRESKKTFWGYYIGEERALGIGGLVPAFLYNWLFDCMGIAEVLCETLYHNTDTLRLHLLQGYRFAPSLDRVVVKNGRESLLVGTALMKSDWASMKRYRALRADFPITRWGGRRTQFTGVSS